MFWILSFPILSTAACRVNNRCGENAVCVSEAHKAVCFCRDGFRGDPLKGCQPINFCADEPCGDGARCYSVRGSYKCLCPPGTVGDAYTDGCKPPVECLIDTDCPISAFCGKEGNEPKCKDVCAGSECGPNSECNAFSHRAVCSCIEGYEGDATDLVTGCRPQEVPCRANSDCPPSTVCDGGLCRREFPIYYFTFVYIVLLYIYTCKFVLLCMCLE